MTMNSDGEDFRPAPPRASRPKGPDVLWPTRRSTAATEATPNLRNGCLDFGGKWPAPADVDALAKWLKGCEKCHHGRQQNQKHTGQQHWGLAHEDHRPGFGRGWRRFPREGIFPCRRTFPQSGPDARGYGLAEEPALGVNPRRVVKDKGVLECHNLTFHAQYFRDMCHSACAVLEPAQLHYDVHGAGNLFSDGPQGQVHAGHQDQGLQPGHGIARACWRARW